ncbi:MAG: GNAT family N-acetyltransferase [Woeseia sp.]|nr:GNAT family N-acetyltransferase [Woeseia sp.]NNE59306.1 GNAT family N-acetyltransferase [Woeseia sp.]NNL54564.1 GNAT family N-acetyltransferase [Woeseia sp.]
MHIQPYYLIREGTAAVTLKQNEHFDELAIVVATPEDIPRIAACQDWVTEELLQGRFEKGHLCMMVVRGEELVGHTWVDFEEVHEAYCDYELQSDEAYLFDAFIKREYRGFGLAPYVRKECYEYLARIGRRQYYSISDYFNTPAIRFKKKLHAEIFRLYLYVKIGRYTLGNWVLKDYQP